MYSKNALIEFTGENSNRLQSKSWWSDAIVVDTDFSSFRHALEKSWIGFQSSKSVQYKEFNQLNNHSRLYISAHCSIASETIQDGKRDSMSYRKLAKCLSHILTHPSLKQNAMPFLRISLIACYAGLGSSEEKHQDSFAANLQLELQRKYHIYVEVVARNFAVACQHDKKLIVTNMEKFKDLKAKVQTCSSMLEELKSTTKFLLAQNSQSLTKKQQAKVLENLQDVKQVMTINSLNHQKFLAAMDKLIKHKFPRSKVIYRWLPNGQRQRIDAYTEVYSREWRTQLTSFILKNIAHLPQYLSALLQQGVCLSTDFIVDNLNRAIEELKKFKDRESLMKILELKVKELCEANYYTEREPTLVLS